MPSAVFRVKGIEPAHDPAWAAAPEPLRREFWAAVVKIVLDLKDKSLAKGLDRHGQALVPIAASTRAHRHSAMGTADPDAPPLTPAYGLSRTRSLLAGRAFATHAEFFWKFDTRTGATWGKILLLHRKGGKNLPVRDVIGLSPADQSEARRRAWAWWAARVHGQGSPESALPPPKTLPIAATQPTPKTEAIPGANVAKVYRNPVTIDYHTKAAGAEGMISEGWYQKRRIGGISYPTTSPPPSPKAKPKPPLKVVPAPAKPKPRPKPYFSGHPQVHDRVAKPEGRPAPPEKHEPPPPPKPKPKAPPKPKPEPFPASPEGLKVVKRLGGSTGAELVEDDKGRQFVRKRGANPGQLREEAIADAAYRAAGVPVASTRLYETPDGPVKLAAYERGTTLGELMRADPQAAEKAMAELRKGFVADALFGNWDVIGASHDNILVTPAGKVLRIDNGGSLRYRAQGALKAASQWTGTVGELKSMRSATMNPSAAKVFGAITDAEIRKQAKALVKRREAILAAVPPELRPTLAQRLDYLATVAAEKPAKAPKPRKIKGWTPLADDAVKRFGSVAEMEDWGRKNYGDWARGLTQAQKDAVRYYTGSGYGQMNPHLWDGRYRPEQSPRDSLERQIRDLDAALRDARLPEAIEVRRGVSDLKAMDIDAGKLEYGSVIEAASFWSTTLKQAGAGFGGGSRGAYFIIRLPKGSPGAYLNSTGSYSAYPNEREFLVPPYAQFRVIKVDNSAATPQITMEYIP
jgi:hypothetical protein